MVPVASNGGLVVDKLAICHRQRAEHFIVIRQIDSPTIARLFVDVGYELAVHQDQHRTCNVDGTAIGPLRNVVSKRTVCDRGFSAVMHVDRATTSVLAALAANKRRAFHSHGNRIVPRVYGTPTFALLMLQVYKLCESELIIAVV